MSMEIRGAERGTTRMMSIMAMGGSSSFSVLDTSLSGVMTMLRSFSVVRSFISGGWIKATLAI